MWGFDIKYQASRYRNADVLLPHWQCALQPLQSFSGQYLASDHNVTRSWGKKTIVKYEEVFFTEFEEKLSGREERKWFFFFGLFKP